MTDPSAPSPITRIPQQQDSSALDRAAAAQPTHPAEPHVGDALTVEDAERREAELLERNRVKLADHVRHVHIADRDYNEATPVSIAGELYLDGECLYKVRTSWSVTGGPLEETLLTLRVPRGAVTVTPKDADGFFTTRLFGKPVLTTDRVPFPDLLGDPLELVDITLIVGRFTVGPRPETE